MEERDSFKSRLGFILVSAGLCHRYRECVEVSIYYRRIWRCCFCTVLSGVFNPSRDSGGYDGTGCRPFEPQKRAPRF